MFMGRGKSRIVRVAFTAALGALWLFAVVQGQGFHHHEDEPDHEEQCPICVAMLAAMLLLPLLARLAPDLPWFLPFFAARILPHREDRACIRLRGPPISL